MPSSAAMLAGAMLRGARKKDDRPQSTVDSGPWTINESIMKNKISYEETDFSHPGM
jgi:hypothetical protein